jgi:hypothetical protein
MKSLVSLKSLGLLLVAPALIALGLLVGAPPSAPAAAHPSATARTGGATHLVTRVFGPYATLYRAQCVADYLEDLGYCTRIYSSGTWWYVAAY